LSDTIKKRKKNEFAIFEGDHSKGIRTRVERFVFQFSSRVFNNDTEKPQSHPKRGMRK
jgi:hypothetical protein